MSDAPVEVATGSVESAPAPVVGGGEPVAAGAAPAPAVEAEASILDQEIPADVRMFDREYVEKLRSEAASQRVGKREALARAAELERLAALGERIDRWDEESQPHVAGLLDRLYGADDTQQMAVALVDWSRNTLGVNISLADAIQATQEAQEAVAEPDYDPYDPESTAKFVAEQVKAQVRAELEAFEQQRQIDAQVLVMHQQIEAAGYDGEDALDVIARAQRLGSLEASIAYQKAKDEAAEKRGQDKLLAGKTPTPNVLPVAGQAGVEPPPERPKTFAEANKAADEWVRQRSLNANL